MAKAIGTITLPVLVRMPDGKELELGAITLDVKRAASGRVKRPTLSEVRAALRKIAR